MQILTPVLAITGHRKIEHDEHALRIHIRGYLRKLKPSRVYLGMALGFDMMVAEECIALKIPFVACVPYKGQEKYWLPSQRKRYLDLLEKADRVDVVCKGGFAHWKYLRRNDYLLKSATHVMAYWSGEKGSGTGYTVNVANKKQLPVFNLFTSVKKVPSEPPKPLSYADVPEEN